MAQKPVAKKVVAPAKPAAKAPAPKPVAKPEVKKVVPVEKPVAKIEKEEIVEKKEETSNKGFKKPEPVAKIQQPNTDDRNRYSDPELKEFKELIQKKLDSARSEYTTIADSIQSIENTGYLTLEDGSTTEEKERLSQMAARQKKYIENLENALIRIENKTYGICKVTGKLISKERLRAVPHTTQSIEAKLQQYK